MSKAITKQVSTSTVAEPTRKPQIKVEELMSQQAARVNHPLKSSPKCDVWVPAQRGSEGGPQPTPTEAELPAKGKALENLDP